MQPLALVLALAQAPAAAPPPAPAPPSGPVVALEVFSGQAKLDNFLKYVRAGHYDGTIFHRVIPGFMVQGGGYTPDMTENPTRPPIRNEARNGRRNSRGTVAMARTSAPDSANSQFFINVKDNHALDYGIRGAGYAVFGEVLEGMEVVDRIVAVPTTSRGGHQDVPTTPVVIRTPRHLKPKPNTNPPAPKKEEPKP